jgi:hypothetical protein
MMMNATLETAERTPEGWLVIDVDRRNDDPHQMDDCWHRGAFTRWTVRGTRLVVESQPSDGIGDAWDRLMQTLIEAGFVGTFELVGGGEPCRRIMSNETYTEEWKAARLKEMAEMEAAYPSDGRDW